jgi:nucleoside-triphosphatase THEP1
MSKGKICILCGVSGIGKTTAFKQLLELLIPLKLDCRGILCPPVFQNGEKIGIDLLDITTGEEIHLAQKNLAGETKLLATRGWKLNAQAVRKGNQILENATPCDILFVDELGPLEFERGEGLLKGFSAIESHTYEVAFISIRPSLLDTALDRWPGTKVIQMDHYNQDALINKLFKQLDLS